MYVDCLARIAPHWEVVYVCLCVCARASASVCRTQCVRACVRACVHACARVPARDFLSLTQSLPPCVSVCSVCVCVQTWQWLKDMPKP
jgi:hypothetical protein